MNRARLVKRGATIGQKLSEQASLSKPEAKTTGKVVKAWLTKRRVVSQTEARQAFAALFT